MTAVAVGERQGRPVIVSGGWDGTVRVWDLDSGEPVLGPLTGHDGCGVPRWRWACGRAGRSSSPAAGDGTVRVWDLDSGEPVLGPLTGHDGWVYAVAVGRAAGPAGHRLRRWDGTVRVWDLDSGEPALGPLTGYDGWVDAVAVGERQGRPVIVSGGCDGTVRVWDLDSGEPALGPLTGHDGVGGRGGGRRAAGPAGHRLRRLTTGRCGCGTWTRASRCSARSPATTAAVNAVAVGERQGRPVIVSGGDDRTVRVWDLESGEPVLGPLTGHDGAVYAVAVGVRRGRPVIVSGGWRPDGAGVGSGVGRAGARPAHRPRGWVSRGGGRRAAGSAGHRLRRPRPDGAGVGPGVRRAGARPAHRPRRRGGAVAVGERRGRPVIVSGGRDGTVRVWDLETGEPALGPLTGHDGEVCAVAVGERRAGRSSSPAATTGRCGCGTWRSGEPALGPLTGHDGKVAAVAVGERRRSAGHRLRRRRPDGAGVGPGAGQPALGPLTGHDGRRARGGGRRAAGPAGHRLRLLGRDGAGVGPGVRRAGARPAHRPPRLGVRGGGRQWRGRPVIVSGGGDRTVRVWDLESERHPALRIELQYRACQLPRTTNRLVIGTTAELLRVDLL